MTTEVIILAAGQGSRMKSNLPKVLHKVAGKAMLQHVIDSALAMNAEKLTVVVGHGGNKVKQAIKNKVNWVEQTEQLGTGHAVLQAQDLISDDNICLILYGDVPMIDSKTLDNLVSQVKPDTLGLLTVEYDDPTGYGRIIRDENGAVRAIVEQKDATPEQLEIGEINTGIMAVNGNHLKKWLPALSNKNATGEYYLTDIIEMAVRNNIEVAVVKPTDKEEVKGVNDREQLAKLERWLQQRQAKELMASGATLLDPERIDIRGQLSCGKDVTIDINCIFEGDVTLADNVSIGSNCYVKNTDIGEGTVIHPNTIIEDAKIGSDTNVGPFARIRPGTELANRAKVGNFVETKKTVVGEGSKINHLSYVGDATLGNNVNVGAGTITCNYDGVNKFETQIGDEVFVGSNTSLVAPVEIGSKATIGAGSVVTKKVDQSQLAVARARQKNLNGWQRPKKSK